MNLIEKAYLEVEKNKENIKNDYHRLNYHFMPPVGLLNDPNGFMEFNSTYHLFYQWNPFECGHGAKFWGHKTSKDLVNWTEEKIALAPEEWYETHGCYSGSGIEIDGEMVLFYTGNVKDKDNNRETYQCLATSKDGINFKKLGPVIENTPEGYTRHYRDPKAWKKGDTYYTVIGAQSDKGGKLEGKTVMYSSKDFKTWEFLGNIAGANEGGLGDLGFMWECPDLFELDGREVLIASPQGVKPQGDLYNNLFQTGYFVGDLDYTTAKFNHGEFIELDRGFDFYAPQTTLDSKGRRVLVAWMAVPDVEEFPTKKFNWIHCMTLPRELKLVDNKVVQLPIEELKTLRKENFSVEDIRVNSNEVSFENFQGDSYELEVEIDNISAKEFGIDLRTNGNEKVTLGVSKNKVYLDRSEVVNGLDSIRRVSLEDTSTIKLRIFIDTSSIEVFVNNGEETFTGRIFPSKESNGIKFFSKDGEINIKKANIWKI